MITVIHGDNFVLSRNYLLENSSGATRLEAGALTPEALTQILESASLFSAAKILVINHLPKDIFLDILAKHLDSPVFIWEKKSLTPAVSKKLIKLGFVLKEFKLTKKLWQFLNTLSLKDFHETLVTDPVELVFYWLHRRVSQNLQKNPDPKWLKLHHQLLEADFSIKSGRLALSLTSQLDLILASL